MEVPRYVPVSDPKDPPKYVLFCDVYEGKLNAYLGAMCHRNAGEGWVRDKYVRDAGPWIGRYANGAWSGQYYGTHSPVLMAYPDATLLQLSKYGLEPTTVRDTVHFKTLREFFEDPRGFVEAAIEE